MATLTRALSVATPVQTVAPYLSDLVTSVQWDPHTVSCVRLDDGPVGVGARYQHVRTFEAYRADITYEVTEYVAGERVRWHGTDRFASGTETFVFTASGTGTVVEHTVEVTLAGIARLLGDRLLPTIMRRIADDGTEVLRSTLEALA